MFHVIRFSKQCGSGYINTLRCPLSHVIAYHNEQTVGSAAILCLHNAPAVEVMHVSFVPCLISPASHYSVSLFRVSPFRVSSVPCLICSVSHLFCGLSFQYLTYSVSQDLDRFPTLRLCLNFKPRLGINHAWRELRCKAVGAVKCI